MKFWEHQAAFPEFKNKFEILLNMCISPRDRFAITFVSEMAHSASLAFQYQERKILTEEVSYGYLTYPRLNFEVRAISAPRNT